MRVGGSACFIDVTTSRGFVVRLRRGLPSDEAALRAGFEHLSEESRFHRFFTAMPELTDQLVEQFVNLDDHGRLAVAAFDPAEPSEVGTDDGLGIGVARCIPARTDVRSAEFAVTVIDPYQGLGVGRVLMEALVVGALRSGLTTIYGHVLHENSAMVRVLGRLGGRDQFHERPEPGTRRIAIDLEAAATTLGGRRRAYATLFS